jgi:two-component system, OmpR family, KDP operon response regulator KdpE
VTGVLVVDDEPQILRTLAIHLRARGYEVHTARTGAEALVLVDDRAPDAVILDLGLPDMEGIDVVRALRCSSATPILVLSGRSDSRDKVTALDSGADDYVTKPFGMDELLARLRALHRRSTGPVEPELVRIGDVMIDLTAHTVTDQRDDIHEELRLTPTEWHLLETLVRNPGRLLSRRRLIREVWGAESETTAGNLRVYMAQLRRKLERDPHRPQHLVNEPGMGYRFEPAEPPVGIEPGWFGSSGGTTGARSER